MTLSDGIYFNLDADTYHRLERLSCSFIQKMRISPATAWAGSWMDPDRPTDDEEATAAQIFGRFTHAARLEPETVDKLYVRKLEKSDFPPDGALYTGTEIEAQLAERGLPKTVKGEKVLDKAYRLYDAGYDAGVIWPIVVEAWEAERGERTPITGKGWDETLRDAERLRQLPDVAQLLTGGYAEVTILWTCPQTGIPMKARLDYLRPTDWTDLKTYANMLGKNLLQAISDAFRYNRYYIQAALYRDAVRMAMLDDENALPVHGDDAQRAMIAELRARTFEPDCWYVFQEKGGVPNILARRIALMERMSDEAYQAIEEDPNASPDKLAAARRAHEGSTPMPTMLLEKGQREIAQAKRDFVTYSDYYEKGQPWLPLQPVGELSDADFNPYWLEERN